MPVVNFHLVEGQYSDEQAEALLVGAATLYADVLEAPMERIRAFITPHPATQYLAAGQVVSKNNVHAPIFEFIVLEGRTLEQRHYLIKAFTELLAETLGIEMSVIRGFCRRVDPEEWGIGGTPASVMRAGEIQARKDAAK